MDIKLKYNEGDTVWYIRNNKLKSTKLYHGFKIECIYNGYNGKWGDDRAFPIRITYLIEKSDRPDNDFWLRENELFESKDLLINSL